MAASKSASRKSAARKASKSRKPGAAANKPSKTRKQRATGKKTTATPERRVAAKKPMSEIVMTGMALHAFHITVTVMRAGIRRWR